uniref:Putative capsid protein n=2 Tax=viral metagenome TaxID=1070528 RepID=A0A6M3ISL8_9ZZZZ
MYFDEEFLNNLRKEGTESQYLSAQARLARELAGIVNRSNRRKEWMFANMLFAGSFSYSERTGVKISVDYNIPSTHLVTLGAAYKWSTGTSRDIIGDIIDGKKLVKDDCGGDVDFALCNSTVLKYLARDPELLTLLSKSTFGTGDLFSGNKNSIVGVNPKVLGALLDIKNLMIYDEQYEVRAYLTAVVTADSTVTISVDNPADFVAGETLRFHDVSAGTYEDETIASVAVESGTVTVSTAPSTSYKAGEDYVSQTSYFVPNTKFAMFASMVDGQKIAEYKQAPYGLIRKYGISTDKHEEWDPEGVYIRVQDKGLPICYQRDASYVLAVA